jgi:8-oxo-dGTP diphosphatase
MTKQTFILPAVAAAIFNTEGEILLHKRKDVNKWCVISGHVEFGETIEQAILREIKEETNTDAAVVRFIGVYSSPSSQTYHYNDKSIQYITSYFEARLHSEPEQGFSNTETAELRYFKTDDLPSDMDQLNPYWLSDALAKKEGSFLR